MAAKLSLASLFQRNLRAAMEHPSAPRTQLALAKRSGVAQASIGRILRGEQIPTLKVVEDLAHALEVEPWMMLVNGFNPGNPPVLRPVPPEEQALYERLLLAAQAIATYKADDP